MILRQSEKLVYIINSMSKKVRECGATSPIRNYEEC